MKGKRLALYIIGVVIVILVTVLGAWIYTKEKVVVDKNTNKVLNTITNTYVAYIKINPSVKLEYQEVCTEYVDGTKECTNPEVSNYELINDDAKEILKNVDLYANGKDLAKVIELICDKVEEKGISIKDIKIESDWNELDNYLDKESENETTMVTNNINVEVKETENITSTITEDIKVEQQEKAKKEEEARIKAEKTIYLSENVTYSISGRGYCCDNCFTTSLINTFKNAQGYYVTQSSASRIDYQKISTLSGKYNSSKYFGTDLTSKLTSLGAEECGGLGGGIEPLTKDICNQFHLTCE